MCDPSAFATLTVFTCIRSLEFRGVFLFFFNVRCGWSSHVACVFLSFALLCLSGFWEGAIRLLVHVSPLLRSLVYFQSFYNAHCAGQFTCQPLSAVLLFPSFCICHGDWFIHMSSVLNSYCGSHPPARGRGVGASLF